MEETGPLTIRRADDISYEPVEAADGLEKGVLIDEDYGGTEVAIRRFTLAAGGQVPKHTNEIEHAQYVLTGGYTVGVGDSELKVSTGDSVHIPAGAVHWYRNHSDEPGAFICAVPVGNDDIQVLE
jgi:quercetin dioxygenase-like cupin family protein